MAIKPFSELMALDLKEHISKKPILKKEGGDWKKIGELDYLSWPDCLCLLYLNGAAKVVYGNVRSGSDHPLFLIDGRAPFVRVYVEVDGDRRELDYPVIDGARDISMDKLVQSDVHNATQRGFVKCVAINWGLGLSLWQKEEREAENQRKPSDNLEFHNIMAIKERVNQIITKKMQNGMSFDDFLSCMNLSKHDFDVGMDLFTRVYKFEQLVRNVK